MNDQSSESSGEWSILGEVEEEWPLDRSKIQSCNLELSYDAVPVAVSECIRSSLCNEDFELQYEIIEKEDEFLSDNDHEELSFGKFDVKYVENLLVNQIEDIDLNNSSPVIDHEEDVNISSISKTPCYKHDRNHRLNFILDITLALVLSLAIGLGTGHFIGWSNKCQKSISELVTAHLVVPPDGTIVRQSVEDLINGKKIAHVKSLPEQLQEDLTSNSESGGGTPSKEICVSDSNNDVDLSSDFLETSDFMATDVFHFILEEESKQNDISELGHYHIPNVTEYFSLKGVSAVEPVEKTNEHLIFPYMFSVETKVETFKGISEHSPFIQDMSSVETKDSLPTKDMNDNAQSNSFEKFYIKNEDSYKTTNFTYQLQVDLNEIIQSLNAVVLTHVMSINNKYSTFENAEVITKSYNDFQNLINRKFSDVDNFIRSGESKKYQFSFKHLQKMIYSIIDSVDYLMKMSIKAFSRDYRKINANKFSKNISKIIFNFEKRWVKNEKFWTKNVEKAKSKKFKEKFFKKVTKYSKKRVYSEKDSYKNKYKRYSMKS